MRFFDDGMEKLTGELAKMGSNYLKFGSTHEVGMRFQNIMIPHNATIINAYIELET